MTPGRLTREQMIEKLETFARISSRPWFPRQANAAVTFKEWEAAWQGFEDVLSALAAEGETPPAPLVEVVREWQEARVTYDVASAAYQDALDGDRSGLVEDRVATAAFHRMTAAEAALLAYPLPAPVAGRVPLADWPERSQALIDKTRQAEQVDRSVTVGAPVAGEGEAARPSENER